MTRARDLSQSTYLSGTWTISAVAATGAWYQSGTISFGKTFDNIPKVIFSPDYRANPKYYSLGTVTTTGFTLYHWQVSGQTLQNSGGSWIAMEY